MSCSRAAAEATITEGAAPPAEQPAPAAAELPGPPEAGRNRGTALADAVASPEAVPVTPPGAKHLVLIDGSGYIFRAFHALPPMTRPDGTPVNAVFGFTQMLSRFLTEHRGSHLAVVFDPSRVTFRNEIYPDYKAHRPDPPEELIPQFALIREATAAFGVACIEQPGFEADDMIATYAREFAAAGGEVTIVSSDKDLMQLVRPGVRMLDPIKQKPIGEAEVVEKFGVPPEKVVEVQALIGDPVDNVPGVPKIGPKTAAELIQTYGDLESVLANTAKIKQPMRRQNLEQYAEQARLSKRLVQLVADAPLTLEVEALAVKPPEPARLSSFLAEQGFRSVLARMGLGEAAGDAGTRAARQAAVAAAQAAQVVQPVAPSPGQAPFGDYATVTTMEALAAWIAEGFAAGIIGLDTETDSLDALKANLVGVCLATAPGRACYIPLRHVTAGGGQGDMLAAPAEAPQQIPFVQAMDALRPLLTDPGVLKVLQHAKYDLEVLARPENGGIAVSPVDDTMLISYAMAAGKHGHGMDELSVLHLDHKPVSFDSVTGTGRARIPFSQVPLDKATAYAAEDADVTLRLWHILRPKLREEQALALYEQVERRMVGVLRDMEVAGIKVDGTELARIGEDFSQRMAALEQEIHALAGRPFNVGSPKQLGEILFDEMKLPGGRRSKATGAWGTDASVLEDLAAQGIPLPRKVLDWRQLAKLKSTYVEGLAAALDPRTGRVHTDFSMANTSTGRLASTEPNLQNIPIRTEEGVKIRRAFVAEPGHVLLAADYSQIELRLLAHLADVPALREAFATGQDIHSRTAADIFRLAPDAVDKEARRRAKTINFGIIYGMSAFGLAARLGIGPGEARGIIDAYFAQYPGIRDAMERLKEEARLRGYVSTSFGRKLWIPDINAKDMARRAGAERAAINAPFQGGAAEVIKRAMVRLPRALADAGLKARMLLQVHDELVFEVPETEVEPTGALVRQVMEGVAQLRVPLAVEIGTGHSWAEAH
ncbi:DNA polymerase I [Siccirubricoccus sp. KC 17139]|uniref:DNA polymerase I n=1 Tax=Siccirubricoccus soli TaxID=2899147 RepID=A0ABT1D3H8_9PROT|nr:DNA polymerase I [Siccirubricoccus soli]MCO6416476.1 DNA polymerase I [Siccirubricoccus soli]MCP2682610.1 DNA polymerase I [Siccirubricoccus soli]